MKLYIGVTKEEELYYIEWDKVDNEQKKTFSLCGGCYNEPKTEEEGENDAREVLSDASYYEDLGYIQDNSFLNNFIDFEKVAEHIINTDGWENTNGEYTHFGEYENEEIYLNASSGGQHQEEIKNFKELFISKEDLKKIYSLWDKYHLKDFKDSSRDDKIKNAVYSDMNNIFNKYKNLCSDEEALIKYLDCIEWRQ